MREKSSFNLNLHLWFDMSILLTLSQTKLNQ